MVPRSRCHPQRACGKPAQVQHKLSSQKFSSALAQTEGAYTEDSTEGPLPVGAHTWNCYDKEGEETGHTLTVTLLSTGAEVVAAREAEAEMRKAQERAKAS